MWVGPFPRAARAFERVMRKFIDPDKNIAKAKSAAVSTRAIKIQALIDAALAAKQYDRLGALYKQKHEAEALDKEAEEAARRGRHWPSLNEIHACRHHPFCAFSRRYRDET